MIEFPAVTLLDYSQNSRFTGAGLRIGVERSVTIEGNVENFGNNRGIKDINDAVTALKQLTKEDYQEIVVNGIALGKGKISEINFNDERTDVWIKKYTVSLSVWQEGLFNGLSGDLFDNLGFMQDPSTAAYLTENFSEDFSVSKSPTGYAGSRSISIRFHQNGSFAPDLISKAQEFATLLFNSTVPVALFDATTGFIFAKDGRRTHEEVYNRITGECQFSEDFEIGPLENPQDSASNEIIHQIALDEDGFVTVQESGTVLAFEEPVADNIKTAINGFLGGAFSRCQAVFNAYSDVSWNPLLEQHTTSSSTLNTFSGEGSYSITFTTNRLYENTGITFSYDHTYSEDDEGLITIDESGEIRGWGTTLATRNQNVDTEFPSIRSNIESRILAFRNSLGLSDSLDARNLVIERNRQEGTLTYTQEYSNKPDEEIVEGLEHTFEINENGIITVVESFNISEVSDPVSNMAGELSPSGAFARCNDVFNYYIASLAGSVDPLINVPVTTTKNANLVTGVGSYSVNFTNDPQYENTGVRWNYEITEQLDSEDNIELVESGEIAGLGDTLNARNTNALSHYNTMLSNIPTRLTQFYSGNGTLTPVSRTISRALHEGTINYSATHNDNPDRDNEWKVEASITDNFSVDVANNFRALETDEMRQVLNNKTPFRRDLSMEIKSLDNHTLAQFRNKAIAECNTFIPSGLDVYVSECSYDFNPLDEEFSINVQWNYF